jgi:monofunctional biosynthetic peptidoglycan transglycosylase
MTMASSIPRFFRMLFSFGTLKRAWRWGWRLLLVLLLADIVFLATIWPQWDRYVSGPLQKSKFMLAYESEQQQRGDWPRMRWNPVPINRIPRAMRRAAVVAEDARFYEHGGVDLEAFREAMETNLERKRIVYGASTISQQTVKNLFLSPSRDPLRKWHELWLTLGMERNLSKRRILEHYLNVAEFGRGIYGVDAAARHYYGVPASRLSAWQAIELAATLPSPVYNNPSTRTRAFKSRVSRIRRHFY